MGILTWTFFWPESSKKKPFFHIYRHLIIVFLSILAIYFLPSILTFFLLVLSSIEYTRNARYKPLFVFFITFSVSICICSELFIPKFATHKPRMIVYDLLRSTVLFLVGVFDRLTVKRFGASSFIATISFPVLAAGCSELLSSFDRLGIATHVSSFCEDYPEVTFIPQRFLGPAGLIMTIAFLANSVAQWHRTRVVPRYVTSVAFRTISVILFIFYSYQYFRHKDVQFMNISLIYNIDDIARINKTTDLFVVVNPLIVNKTNQLIELSKKRSAIIAFSFYDMKENESFDINTYENNATQYLSVVSSNGKVLSREIKKDFKEIIPVRIFLKDMLVLNTENRRIGFIVGREMYKPEYFTAKDIDLLVTFGNSLYDEECMLSLRTAKIVSQMIGATRIHGSLYMSYGMNSNGKLIFMTKDQNSDPISLKVTRNPFFWNGIRFLIIGYIIIIISILIVLINLLPMRYVNDIIFYVRNMKKLFRS